ncbi:Arsenate reductase [Candidatus Burkholderia humilis]|nr:Arsenate reductase [Candidatus Burkholderia humilis]
MTVTIYHNPKCGTSRNTLALIRNAGIEPIVVEYLTHPPSRDVLMSLISRSELSVREAICEKGTPYAELGLDDEMLSDDQLIDAIIKHPILINRPFVDAPNGARLCRPSELVIDLRRRRKKDRSRRKTAKWSSTKTAIACADTCRYFSRQLVALVSEAAS